MEFPNFHYPKNTRSFPSHLDVWQYLNSYAKKFNITKHIKFHHLVKEVHPFGDTKWKVSVKDVRNKKNLTETYDAVFVCTGVCSSSYIPKFEGKFKGVSMHSHDYRKAEDFKGSLHIHSDCVFPFI